MMKFNAVADVSAIPSDPVGRAHALQPLIAEHATTAEKEGRIAQPVFEALKAAGLFQITAPKRAGGEGAGMRTFVETVAEIGRSCPGSGWAYGILTGMTGLVAALPDPPRGLLLRRGDELSCFVGAKSGVATATAGGYRITGQWPYASGSLHADWACCGVVVHDADGTPTGYANAFVDLSANDVEIVRDWNVSGLTASGSNRVKADAHFVPSELMLPDALLGNIAQFLDGVELEPRDLWPVEPQNSLTVIPAMLGAAEGMLETVRRKMNDRPILGWHYEHQSDSETLLAMLGEAAMKIRSARMHILRACDEMDITAFERPLTRREIVDIQAGNGYAARLLREAADALLDIAGPGAFALASPIQRYWRDLNIGSRHNALNSGLSLELLGRALTGGKSNIWNIQEIGSTEAAPSVG